MIMLKGIYQLLGLVGVLVTVVLAVKIDNLKVPPQYVLDNYKNPKPLILDCEYDLPVDENGFVLKWYLNDQLIYQWISTTQPRFYVHNFIRSRIDLNYTAWDHIEHRHTDRHRALSITRPTINMTGVYTCAVGTFQSEEKRSSYMQIIVPESEFKLKIEKSNDGSEDINVECSVQDIYPEPTLTIRIREDNHTPNGFITRTMPHEKDGLYDINISGKLKQGDVVIDPAEVHCILGIPNTTYTKRKTVLRFTNHSSNLSAPTKITTTILLMLSSLFML